MKYTFLFIELLAGIKLKRENSAWSSLRLYILFIILGNFWMYSLFSIYGLVKIRQRCRLYTCKLVNCLCDFLGAGLYIKIGKMYRDMTDLLTRHLIKINICFNSEDSRVHTEVCIIYSSKNTNFHSYNSE